MPLLLCFAFLGLFFYSWYCGSAIVMTVSACIALLWAHRTKQYWDNL